MAAGQRPKSSTRIHSLCTSPGRLQDQANQVDPHGMIALGYQ
jgi:hypothetical protein